MSQSESANRNVRRIDPKREAGHFTDDAKNSMEGSAEGMIRVEVDPGRRILIARCFFAAREGTRRANKIRFEWRSFTVENHHRFTSLLIQTACFRILHFECI